MKYIFRNKRIVGLAAIGLLLTTCTISNAQDSIQINGIIRSIEQKPIPNASVSVEGSIDLPVLTNESGEFSMKIPSADVWLMISTTGDSKDKRVNVNDRLSLTITLTPGDMASGDDIQKIMSQSSKSKDLVASHTPLSMNGMKSSSVMSVDQLFQGKIPGVNIINMSGAPGSGAVINVRGIKSLNATNQPLIVVDGIPLVAQGLFESNLQGFSYNPLMAVNQFDISKAILVKDPTVTAAYGSKASNGVIFIETLDPSATSTSIEIDYRNGFSLRPEKEIPLLNASQHRTLVSEVLFSSKYLEEEIVEFFPNLFLEENDDRYIDYQHNTNWQDLIFDNALMTNFNLNVKGGDGIARYGLSFGYTDSKGVIKNTAYKGYNLRFVSLLNIFTWLKMDAGVSLNYSFSDMKEAASVYETSPIMSSLSKSPLLHPFKYDFEGNELTSLSEVDELGVSNPLGTIQNYSASNSNYNFTSTLGLTGKITDNINLKSNFSINYNVMKEAIFMPNKGMELYFNDEAINVAKLGNNSLNSFYNSSYMDINKKFGAHKITSSTGMNLQLNNFQYDWGLTKNAHQNDEYKMIQDGQNNLREIGGQNRSWNWMSFY